MTGPLLLPPSFAGIDATVLDDGGAVAFTLSNPLAGIAQAVAAAVAHPVLLHFRAARPIGTAALVIGGGGYTQLMIGREGIVVARWLNALGIDAHVLVHRFPDARTGPMAALQDVRRAMEMLRAGECPRVGVVGLSSGGHLGACLLAETGPRRPDFAVVGYAPISTNAAGFTVVPDKPPLEPPEKQAFYDAMRPDAQLAHAPPPAFIVYSANDPVVPVANAWRLAAAIADKGGHPEMHVFADAPHGFALDTEGLPVERWPDLCVAWLRQIGALDRV
ncbi:alpha/beta hydrolase [Novosphingobium resinovorum]|uniref:alpha/beta hydrolase n=1 Tax=Novosphingobium resinovorum TaxID=158500 RepID=UPI002ED4042F|nr:alpha/beta hydrolase [Novosphingobium resinovorum]